MPSVAATRSTIKQLIQEIIKESKDFGGKALNQVARPSKLEKAADGATRTGQVIAFLLLGPVIMVSLILIRVVNNLMADVLLGQSLGDQLPILSWLVSFLTLALLMIVAWGWFQFVRTAAFGAFNP